MKTTLKVFAAVLAVSGLTALLGCETPMGPAGPGKQGGGSGSGTCETWDYKMQTIDCATGAVLSDTTFSEGFCGGTPGPLAPSDGDCGWKFSGSDANIHCEAQMGFVDCVVTMVIDGSGTFQRDRFDVSWTVSYTVAGSCDFEQGDECVRIKGWRVSGAAAADGNAAVLDRVNQLTARSSGFGDTRR